MTPDELADVVARVSEPADFSGWGVCPTCRARAGEVCVALNGRVAGGRPDGVRTPLPVPHAARRPRRRGR